MDPRIEELLLDLSARLQALGIDAEASLLGALVVAFAILLLVLGRLLRRTGADGARSGDVMLSAGPDVAATEARPAETVGAVSAGMSKTRTQFLGRLRQLVGLGRTMRAEALESFEELLVTSDLGVKTSQKLLAAVKDEMGTRGEIDEERVRELLKEQLRAILAAPGPIEIDPFSKNASPRVVVVVGVNGVGKTTTIGKLAERFRAQGARVVIAACDTFRAAAAEQIDVWAERAQAVLVRGADGAKPSTVAYEAVHRAINDKADVLIVDTAGRLHTRVNLMNELVAVIKLIERELPGAPHETILVLDATTGQNALQQARVFHERVQLTGVVVTKLDGTPKGGMVVAVKDELGIPVRYIGVGESAADLRPFDAEEFTRALLDDDRGAFTAEKGKGEVRAIRRREAADTAEGETGSVND